MAVEETTFYEKGELKVTNARAIFGPNTFPMANITRVGLGTEAANETAPGFTLLAGIGIAVWGVTLRAEPGITWIVMVVIGLALALMSVLLMRRAKPTYFVKLTTASGDERAYGSEDKGEIETVIGALNEAIIKRG